MSELLTPTSKSINDICLVQMPYGLLEQPNLGLSILQASLINTPLTARILYANLLWAEEIGIHIYKYLSTKENYFSLMGEWSFAQAAFPNFNPDQVDYFHFIQADLQNLEHLIQLIDEKHQATKLLEKFRQQAKTFVDKLAQQIIALQPRIVGCTSTHQQHCASLALLKQIKFLNPQIVTMMGGANCETSPGIITHQKCEWVDFVVSGEADFIFAPLCQQILSNETNNLPVGVWTPNHRRDGYPMVGSVLPRVRVDNLNQVPIPNYDDYFTALYTSSLSDLIVPGLPVEASRGCWWGEVSQCTFCGTNGEELSYRSKAPDRLLQELAELAQRYRTKRFLMVDRIFDMQYLQTVIPTLAEQDNGYQIFYQTKSNLKREHLQLMARAGIRWILPGIEALDNTLLEKIGKGVTVAQNLQFMKWAREAGMFNYWFMLYAIPGDLDELYLNVAQWLPTIFHLQPPAYLSRFEYHRFSPVQQNPARFGLKIVPHRAYAYVYPWDEPSLQQFAYCFVDATQAAGRRTEEQLPPGLRAFKEAIKCWQQEWQKVSLVMQEEGDQLVITDTRSCARQSKYLLTGLARAIYQACDQAQPPAGILKELQATYAKQLTWEVVEPFIQELVEQALLLPLHGRFFSLAVPGPLKPLPLMTDSPAGYLESVAYTKLRKFFKWTTNDIYFSTAKT